jgi:hypothetical protein
MGLVDSKQNSGVPVFVDYYDAAKRKWRSAQVNAEDDVRDCYELVYWDDAGTQHAVRVPRTSTAIQAHGSYTSMKNGSASSAGGGVGGTQVVGLPVPGGSGGGSYFVAGTVVGTRAGGGGGGGGTVAAVPASAVAAASAVTSDGTVWGTGAGSGGGGGAGPQPQFSRGASAPPSEAEGRELAKLLYLTANANIPDGRVDTSGSIGVGDMVDVKKVRKKARFQPPNPARWSRLMV